MSVHKRQVFDDEPISMSAAIELFSLAICLCIVPLAVMYWYQSGLPISPKLNVVQVVAKTIPREVLPDFTMPHIMAFPVSPPLVPANNNSVQTTKPNLQVQSKSQDVDDLIKTGNPHHVLKAFELISACASQRIELANKVPIEKQDDLCGDISAQHLANRMQYAEYAAAARVKNAAVYLLNEGPPGAQKQERVWEQDGNDAWKRSVVQYLIGAAEQGDTAALANLFTLAEYPSAGISQEAAIKFGSATLALIKLESQHHTENRDDFAKIENTFKNNLDTYGKALTKEQVSLAMEAGQKMASNLMPYRSP